MAGSNRAMAKAVAVGEGGVMFYENHRWTFMVTASELGPEIKITTLVGFRIILGTTPIGSRIFIDNTLVGSWIILLYYIICIFIFDFNILNIFSILIIYILMKKKLKNYKKHF
jgi:tetrahydromethanopterin S-methyltransferase subunit D